jgi:hypothetical protein
MRALVAARAKKPEGQEVGSPSSGTAGSATAGAAATQAVAVAPADSPSNEKGTKRSNPGSAKRVTDRIVQKRG